MYLFVLFYENKQFCPSSILSAKIPKTTYADLKQTKNDLRLTFGCLEMFSSQLKQYELIDIRDRASRGLLRVAFKFQAATHSDFTCLVLRRLAITGVSATVQFYSRCESNFE